MNPHNWWAVALIATLLIVGWSLALPLRYDLECPQPRHIEIRGRILTAAAAVLLVWSPYWGPYVFNFIEWACQ